MTIENFIHETNRASSREDLFDVFMGHLKGIGFDRVVYSFMTESPLLNQKIEHGVVRNYPEDWMKYYKEKNYTQHDPVYRTALMSRGPFGWRDLMEKTALTPHQKAVMHEAQEAGLKDGVALSLNGPMGETVGIGLASSAGGIDVNKDLLSHVYLLSHQFHLCYSGLLSDEAQKPQEIVPVLSPRELDVLIWCAKNKSTPVIGEILGISPKTVDYHLSNIFKKLGVNSRILSVLKAVRLGLITP